MNDKPPVLTNQEWAKLFKDKGWEAFMWHIEYSAKETIAALKISEGTDLYRIQGAIQSLDKIKAFQEGVLQQTEEEEQND